MADGGTAGDVPSASDSSRVGGSCVGVALRWGTGLCNVRDPEPAPAPWSAPGRAVRMHGRGEEDATVLISGVGSSGAWRDVAACGA